MAKKAPKRSARKKDIPKGFRSKSEAKRVTAMKAGRKGPRSQPLPGLEQVRNVKLDHICEGIAEERSVMNTARQQEQALISSALQIMQQKNVTAHKHGGVELMRVPGADKLRVRLSKDSGDADVTDGTTTSTNPGGDDESDDESDDVDLTDVAPANDEPF